MRHPRHAQYWHFLQCRRPRKRQRGWGHTVSLRYHSCSPWPHLGAGIWGGEGGASGGGGPRGGAKDVASPLDQGSCDSPELCELGRAIASPHSAGGCGRCLFAAGTPRARLAGGAGACLIVALAAFAADASAATAAWYSAAVALRGSRSARLRVPHPQRQPDGDASAPPGHTQYSSDPGSGLVTRRVAATGRSHGPGSWLSLLR